MALLLMLDKTGPAQVGAAGALQVERWYVFFAQPQFQVVGGGIAQQKIHQLAQSPELIAAGQELTKARLSQVRNHQGELAGAGLAAITHHKVTAQGAVALAQRQALALRQTH
ncbi:hypothetical protein D3C75_1122290 [compost metagenome]